MHLSDKRMSVIAGKYQKLEEVRKTPLSLLQRDHGPPDILLSDF